MRWIIAMLMVSPAAAEVTSVRGLERGEIIGSGDLTGPPVEVSELTGRVLRRPVAAGRPIRPYDVEVASDVVRQQGVSVRFIRGGLTLRTEGRAMDSGRIGERINISLPGRRRPLSAVITGPGVVEVRP